MANKLLKKELDSVRAERNAGESTPTVLPGIFGTAITVLDVASKQPVSLKVLTGWRQECEQAGHPQIEDCPLALACGSGYVACVDR
jgi:hypothetical protein